MYALTVSAAALLSLAPTVSAIGQAIIKNQCSDNVYLWSVSDTPGEMQILSPHGGTYNEAYRTNPDNGGISIKMATKPDQSGAITQFEYTLTNTLWYDISNINGYPFMDSGLTAVPSSSSCNTVTCPAGVDLCKAAYNIPTDDFATAACSTDSDVVVVLCSGQDSSSSSSSAASAVTSAAPPAASLLHVNNNAAVPTSTTPQVLQQTDVVAQTTPIVRVGTNNDGLLQLYNDVFTTLVTHVHKRAPTAVPEPEPAAVPEHKQRRHVHHHHQGEHVLA